jgi:hypothetical protein
MMERDRKLQPFYKLMGVGVMCSMGLLVVIVKLISNLSDRKNDDASEWKASDKVCIIMPPNNVDLRVKEESYADQLVDSPVLIIPAEEGIFHLDASDAAVIEASV